MLFGVWFVFKATEKGQVLSDLLADIVNQSLAGLPIPKRMRWGSKNEEFVRPVHWVVLMHGANVIDAKIMGLQTSNVTFGHRFHAKGEIKLSVANEYKQKLLLLP